MAFYAKKPGTRPEGMGLSVDFYAKKPKYRLFAGSGVL
jgi:hypothetical protein